MDKVKDVERWLDQQDLDRLETDRVSNDLLVEGVERVKVGKVHKSSDKVQEYLARERH